MLLNFLISFSSLNVLTKQFLLLSTNEIFYLLDREDYLFHFGERVESSAFLSEKSIIDLIASFLSYFPLIIEPELMNQNN